MLAGHSADTDDALLGLGLMVDRVLQAIRRLKYGGFSEQDAEALERAHRFLEALVQIRHEDGEVLFRQTTSSTSLSAYGAAIDSLVSSARKPPSEVFDELDGIAGTLESLLNDDDQVTNEDLQATRDFFQMLSRTTLSRGAESRVKQTPNKTPV